MIKIAITGCGGRMGRTLIEAIQHNKNTILGAASERPDSEFLNLDAGELAGVGHLDVKINSEINPDDFDILIDFTRAEPCLAHLALCQKNNKPMVIGTTGFTPEERQTILNASKDIPIVFAPNMSIGVNLTFKLLELVAKTIGEGSDIEIIEAHHRHKVDAPSGTALAMGEVIAKTLDRDLTSCAVYGREGVTTERTPETIGFATVRAGDIIGEHTVMFADIGERIEITHKASSRMTFAKGAVRAANWLATQPASLYDMQDVLNLK